MSAIIRDDFRSLHYLLALGGVAAVTVVVFFGVAFLWLAPPHPGGLPADPASPPQALQADDVHPPAASDQAMSQSAERPDADVAASPMPVAPSNRQAPELAPTEAALSSPNRQGLASAPTGATLNQPARNTHTKKARVARRHQSRMTISGTQREAEGSALGVVPATGRDGTARWRGDASAGPNPGGGFYGSSNFEVGRINPR